MECFACDGFYVIVMRARTHKLGLSADLMGPPTWYLLGDETCLGSFDWWYHVYYVKVLSIKKNKIPLLLPVSADRFCTISRRQSLWTAACSLDKVTRENHCGTYHFQFLNSVSGYFTHVILFSFLFIASTWIFLGLLYLNYVKWFKLFLYVMMLSSCVLHHW